MNAVVYVFFCLDHLSSSVENTVKLQTLGLPVIVRKLFFFSLNKW